MKLVDKDLGFAKLIANYLEMGRLDVQVGIADEFVAIRASVHEFGEKRWHETGKGNPPRSWLRSALRLGERNLAEELARALGLVVDGKLEPVAAMRRVGKAAIRIVRERIQDADNWARPLTAAYAARKQGPGILRESLEMIDALTYRITRGGDVIEEGKA